ncbi:MAG: hypothetical protein ACTHU0_21290 [Kofleriaceae bacterium]
MATYNVKWDATAQGRVAAILTAVQLVVPSAVAADVRHGAVRTGLRRVATTQNGRVLTPSFFTPAAGTGVATTTVNIFNEDYDRATALAAARGTTIEVVLSAALCTGIALQSGVDTTIGPFA